MSEACKSCKKVAKCEMVKDVWSVMIGPPSANLPLICKDYEPMPEEVIDRAI